jgi:hypothetical protein
MLLQGKVGVLQAQSLPQRAGPELDTAAAAARLLLRGARLPHQDSSIMMIMGGACCGPSVKVEVLGMWHIHADTCRYLHIRTKFMQIPTYCMWADDQIFPLFRIFRFPTF